LKALFVTSATNETIKYAESFSCMPGNETRSVRYTNRKPRKGGVVEKGLLDAEVYQAALDYQPDFIVYIGSRWGEIVAIETLQNMNQNIAPAVHLCSDAADHPWWDLLEEYDAKSCFALQVAIDGNKHWPLHGKPRGLTALTPFDPARYPSPKPHAERPVVFGYGGNMGGRNQAQGARPEQVSKRRLILDECIAGGLKVRERVDEGTSQYTVSYAEYAEYLRNCRLMLNVPFSGTQEHMQVKGRVVEAGMAGCVLLEHKGAPTAEWFTPGEDYLEYDNASHAVHIAQQLADKPDLSQTIGARLRAKVLADHGPQAFWGRIMERIGLREVARAAA